jgi:hypothetical protein
MMKMLRISLLLISMMSLAFASDYSVTGQISKTKQMLIQTGSYKIEGEIIPPARSNPQTSLFSIEGVILSGDISGLPPESKDGVPAKLDDLLPDNYYLFQNFPNPFNASTVIKYALPEASHVRIDIYDILGRNIATLVDGDNPAGYNQVLWEPGEMASGMYFYMIRAGEYSEAKKMLLIK